MLSLKAGCEFTPPYFTAQTTKNLQCDGVAATPPKRATPWCLPVHCHPLGPNYSMPSSRPCIASHCGYYNLLQATASYCHSSYRTLFCAIASRCAYSALLCIVEPLRLCKLLLTILLRAIAAFYCNQLRVDASYCIASCSNHCGYCQLLHTIGELLTSVTWYCKLSQCKLFQCKLLQAMGLLQAIACHCGYHKLLHCKLLHCKRLQAIAAVATYGIASC